MIVTLDGPAGAGKSSAARELARRLGFQFLDTGATYRAVTYWGLRTGIDLTNPEEMSRLLAGMNLVLEGDRVLVNGEDVTPRLRTAEVTAASAAVADSPEARRLLASLQREFACSRDVVTEGRDQGTVVFPDALCKFFVTADPNERARRRQQQMAVRGERVELPEVLAAQEQRDRRDAARALAPMVPAADAFVIDTTHLGLDQVVDRMEEIVRLRMAGRKA